MSINKTLFQQKLDELKRAGNERRFNELQSKYQSPETIDYSNMSLRDELQTRFDLDELNRLSAELGKDINSGANISSNSANTLASNDFDNQNSFYTAAGIPTPKYTPKSHAGEILSAGLQGFGEGIESGMLTAVNGATNGYFNEFCSEHLGDYYNQNKQQMQKRAEAAGLGKANQIANDIIEYGANAWADAKSAGFLSDKFDQYGITNWLKRTK